MDRHSRQSTEHPSPEATGAAAAAVIDTADVDGTGARHGGGSVRVYLTVGVVLAVSTVIEVQLPRLLAANHTVLVAGLLVSAFFKAALVALFYMHLRYDSRVYSGILAIAGILVAYLLVLMTFGQLTL